MKGAKACVFGVSTQPPHLPPSPPPPHTPGYVLTDLIRNQIADTARVRGIPEDRVVEDVLLADQPTKRFVTVEEVGALVAFLCTDGARSITGACLSVDGGWTAR